MMPQFKNDVKGHGDKENPNSTCMRKDSRVIRVQNGNPRLLANILKF